MLSYLYLSPCYFYKFPDSQTNLGVWANLIKESFFYTGEGSPFLDADSGLPISNLSDTWSWSVFWNTFKLLELDSFDLDRESVYLLLPTSSFLNWTSELFTDCESWDWLSFWSREPWDSFLELDWELSASIYTFSRPMSSMNYFFFFRGFDICSESFVF